MYTGLKSIRRERALLERNRVLTTSMLEDSFIADLFEATHEGNYFEGVADEELERLIEQIPEDDETDDQLDRILTADVGLDTDDILGVEKDPLKEEIIDEI